MCGITGIFRCAEPHRPIDRELLSAWRRAVASVFPRDVRNWWKVGFDTPVEAWMPSTRRGLIHGTLTSSRARGRGFWSSVAPERFFADRSHPRWFDLTWKPLSIETWAQVFLDGHLLTGVAPGRVPNVA